MSFFWSFGFFFVCYFFFLFFFFFDFVIRENDRSSRFFFHQERRSEGIKTARLGIFVVRPHIPADADGSRPATHDKMQSSFYFVFIRQSFEVLEAPFKYTSVTACVGGFWLKKMTNGIVCDCIRFLFLFSKFYIELCISQIMRSFSRSVIYV